MVRSIGLARAIGAQERHHLAGGDMQIDAADCRHRPIVDAQLRHFQPARSGGPFARHDRLLEGSLRRAKIDLPYRGLA